MPFNGLVLTQRSKIDLIWTRAIQPVIAQSVQFRKIALKLNKNEKSEDYSKADLKQRVLFFITIFRLAIPAFFRFTDVLYILADLISSREI